MVLVHGAFRGAWCWDRVVGELDARGVRNRAVQLPSGSFEDDEAAVRAMIDEAGGPVVLIGHSLGGGLAQQAFAAGLSGPTREIASSHSPFLSHPAELAAIISDWLE